MANTLYEDLKSPITLAILILWPLNSYHTCIVWWCKCGENLKRIRQKLLKLFIKVVKMLTEWRNYRMTDRLKTVYPPKTLFCGGYNYIMLLLVLNNANSNIFIIISTKIWLMQMLIPMQQSQLEIGCKQGFQYTPRKIIWSWPITSYVKHAENLSKISFQHYNSSCTSSVCQSHL